MFFVLFCFFCKKNKKAPLAHLISRVVERPELEVPDVTAGVSIEDYTVSL